MPYVVKGLTVYKKQGHRLVKVGKAKNKYTLKAYLGILHRIEKRERLRRKKKRRRKRR